MLYVGQTKYKMYVGDTPRVFKTEKDYFYVFHSATGIIERHVVSPHFNLCNLVSDGYIYEGYSFSIGNVDRCAGDYALALKNGTFEENYPNVQWTDNKLQDINYIAFDGTAINVSGVGSITVNKASHIVGERADDMTPIPGAIYYLIEVDASKYSTISIVKYGPSKDSNGKYNSYLIFARIATAYYESTTVYVDGVNIDTKLAASYSSSYYLNGTKKTATFNSSGIGYRFIILGSSSLYYGTDYNEAFEDNTVHAVKLVLVTADGIEQVKYRIFQTGDRTDDAETGLVAGYEVAYLESSGTQYIDLPMTVSSGTYFEVDMHLIPRYVNKNRYSVFSANPYAQFEAQFYSSNAQANTITYASTIGEVSTSGGWGGTIDEETHYILSTTGKTTNAGVHTELLRPLKANITAFRIFGSYRNTSRYPIAFHKYKITAGTTVLYDLLSVKIGVVGYMLDLVEGKLYGNSGTGAFILPTEVTETNENE